ncbi:Zinc transport protein ZntB [Defluviimonas aquaemixtae]|uniref:Zinc transport protein ZntB n=1 Tax=Albidovulum aquaemixtae TaxID=1542388 RepID=A0A2R8BMW0_9RHOB|nr:zinc transporter ZntB [Defluviimonas aquaemixtae]SPH24690.1 Zinc transport protein ZntB [Defluviimonas aquaemixtae]
MAELTAFSMDGAGGVAPVEVTDRKLADLTSPEGGFVWVHVNFGSAAGLAWLDAAGLDPIARAALTAEETRPRCTLHGDMALINLRGVNLNPGAEPEDMVSLRLCLLPGRMISTQRRELAGVGDVIAGLRSGHGPATPGDLIARIALRLADRAEPVVAALNERLDDLEDQVSSEVGPELRRELADVRRVSSVLRRFMFPQRDALSTLEIEELDWLSQRDRSRLREATERVTRLAEELDAIRDRAQVVRDQVVDIRAEAMNRQMLVLSVVAAIFLPLGLLTGLLGINVGGIPGSSVPWAFWAVCGLLGVVCLFQIWLFRRLGLLG